MSGCILRLSYSHSPVFLVNSCLDHFSAPPSLEDPLSRSYGVSLPNSLTVSLPSALVYSTRPRVSVYGTGHHALKFSGFSWKYAYPRYQVPPKRTLYFQVRLSRRICLPCSTPTLFNEPFRRLAEVSLLRLRIAPKGSHGMLTVSAIALAVRLRLRTRLTPG